MSTNNLFIIHEAKSFNTSRSDEKYVRLGFVSYQRFVDYLNA